MVLRKAMTSDLNNQEVLEEPLYLCQIPESWYLALSLSGNHGVTGSTRAVTLASYWVPEKGPTVVLSSRILEASKKKFNFKMSPLTAIKAKP